MLFRSYFKPNENYKKRYSYNIAGVEIVQITAFLPLTEVLSVWKNSPAALAGVLQGDKIVEINGERATSLSLNELRMIFETPSNKPLKLTLIREDKEIQVSIEMRDKI